MPGHDEPRRLDADVHAIHREEAAQHQAGARQQHERERDLDDDQSARPAPRANAAGPGPAAFLEHLVHVGRRRVQRGSQSEDETGRQAHDQEEGERAPVHREHHPVGDADVLRLDAEPANPDDREQQADDAGDERQQNALDEQLADDLPAACANRDTDAHLARSSSGLGQEQVGDVRARDQQHEPDRSHQRPEEQRDLRAENAFDERIGVRPEILVGLRILRGQRRADGLELGARLFDGHAVVETPDGEVAPRLPRLPGDGRGHRAGRQPDIRVEGKVHALRHHPDDGAVLIDDADGLADDVRIAAIALPPQRVADQDDDRRARCLFGRA